MDSCDDTPKGWVAPFGHPRINACSRLPVAFRSVPRPSSPPGAKASTECPYRARDLRTNPHKGPVLSHHAQEPSSPKNAGLEVSAARRTSYSAHTTPLNVGAAVAGSQIYEIRLPVRPSQPTTRPETHQNLIHTDKEQYCHHLRGSQRRHVATAF